MGDDVKETLLAEPPNSSKSLSSGSVGSSWGSGQDRNTVRQVESTSDLPKCSYLCWESEMSQAPWTELRNSGLGRWDIVWLSKNHTASGCCKRNVHPGGGHSPFYSSQSLLPHTGSWMESLLSQTSSDTKSLRRALSPTDAHLTQCWRGPGTFLETFNSLLSQENWSRFVVFADFWDINTPVMVSFKLPTLGREFTGPLYFWTSCEQRYWQLLFWIIFLRMSVFSVFLQCWKHGTSCP